MTVRLQQSDTMLLRAARRDPEARRVFYRGHADARRPHARLRKALELRVVHEFSYEEVARAAGISEPNARLRVSRAIRAIGLRLAPREGDST
jgi:predicted RNA polymerase sigma factor